MVWKGIKILQFHRGNSDNIFTELLSMTLVVIIWITFKFIWPLNFTSRKQGYWTIGKIWGDWQFPNGLSAAEETKNYN